jgi:hypothetical protein
MLKHTLLLLLLTCCVAWAEDEIDKTAPGRFAAIVRRADYVVRDAGTIDNPREKRISDPQVKESIAQILSKATYHPCLHGFSITPGLFDFYTNGKLSMGLTIHPGRTLRFSNSEGEENMEVEQSTIDALIKVYKSTGP